MPALPSEILGVLFSKIWTMLTKTSRIFEVTDEKSMSNGKILLSVTDQPMQFISKSYWEWKSLTIFSGNFFQPFETFPIGAFRKHPVISKRHGHCQRQVRQALQMLHWCTVPHQSLEPPIRKLHWDVSWGSWEAAAVCLDTTYGCHSLTCISFLMS